ncbi:hypothetical protein D9613_009085 [Agrocybe pediades]|uniref:Uncharacterized protein n=1 Tax=Agrocybe pediades TaxID=84607 RepID=A0A8H4R3B9_9AGAR|nr:hypothetical protein D9613_009085 [Agrocybe pediades]
MPHVQPGSPSTYIGKFSKLVADCYH